MTGIGRVQSGHFSGVNTVLRVRGRSNSEARGRADLQYKSRKWRFILLIFQYVPSNTLKSLT